MQILLAVSQFSRYSKSGIHWSYVYDAWGNILSTGSSMASTVGEHNPIRYRSYAYDQKTGPIWFWGGFMKIEPCYDDLGTIHFLENEKIITYGKLVYKGYGVQKVNCWIFSHPTVLS